MPKYVCDFDVVKSAAKQISKSGESMISSVDTYCSNVNDNLSNWDSDAKNAFSQVNFENVSLASYASKYAELLGEFLNTAADEIEKLEGELSKIKI